jgi:hypothetical protein
VCLVVESDAGRMTGRLGWRHFVGEDRRILNFVIQTELPACVILHLLHNLYIDMIYGKTKINGCEKIVKRLYFILEYLQRDRRCRWSASAKTTDKWSLHRALKILVRRGVIRKL